MIDATQKYLRIGDVRRRYGGIGSSTVYRWIQQGLLPAATKIGPKASAWSVSELEDFDRKLKR